MFKGPRSSFVDQAIKGEFVAETLSGYLGTERKNFCFLLFSQAIGRDTYTFVWVHVSSPPPLCLPPCVV